MTSSRMPFCLPLAVFAILLMSAPVPYTAPDADLNRDGFVDTSDLQCEVRLFYALVLAGHPDEDKCESDEECNVLLADTYCRPGFTLFDICVPQCVDPSVPLGESPDVVCDDPEADDAGCLGTTQKLNADLNCDGHLGNEDLNFLVAVAMGKAGGPDSPDHDGDGQLNWCDDDTDGDGDPDVTDCEPLNEAVSTITPELCNLLDEDCDGLVDEDLGTTTCGLAVCEHSIDNCVEGEEQVCDPFAGAGTELCNDIDDDCDGDVDEDFPLLDTPCDSADSDLCANGSYTCVGHGGWVECASESVVDIAEVCDGLDNDCDGVVDNFEAFGETTCGLGSCRHTIDNCQDGALAECDPFLGIAPEIQDGLDNDCDGLLDEDFVVPGTVLVTEIMQNPDCSSDNAGEWFEVYNNSDMLVDLNGWVLMDEEEDFHAIAAQDPVLLGPGEFAVLGRDGDPVTNGGVAVTYEYQDFQLANSIDQVILVLDGMIVDEVSYDGGTEFPDPNGAAMSLSIDAHTLELNDVGTSWCEATGVMMDGCGDLGTPGTANPLCDADNDGYSIPGGDCDEEDPQLNPGMDDICNGLDDDCSGQTDEGFPTKGEPCDGIDADDCINGTYTCAPDGSGVECVNESEVDIVDICDGLDNDCDGSADEDFPTLGQACDSDDSDECTNGTFTCKPDGSDVECVNESQVNIADVCDGLDNDCDGGIDEDYPLKDEACDGADSDLCTNGTFTCAASGLVVECVNEAVEGIVEKCNGADDDCDGLVDEDFLTKGQACDSGDSDLCAKGTYTCSPDGSGVECVNESEIDIVEVCDSLDNDCDGQVDEDWVCCLELGDVCGDNIQCCTKICNVNCCEATCAEDGWVCEAGAASMRDWYCNQAGACAFNVTATEDCGTSGPSGIHQCVDQVLQAEYLTKGCSQGGCYSDPSWNVIDTCLGTCAHWCNQGQTECVNAPELTQNAGDCQGDGWYCNGIDREHRDYRCDGAGDCTYEVTELEPGGSSCQLNDSTGPVRRERWLV